GGRTTGETVHVLGFLRRPEGRDHQTLGVAALEERGAVHAGEQANLGGNRTGRLRVTAIGADTALEHRVAVRLVLQVFEGDGEVDVGELAFTEFREKRGLGLFLQRLDVGGADLLLLAENRVADLRGDDALDNGAGLGRGFHQVELRLRLSDAGDEFLDRLDDGLDRLVAELEGFDEALFGQLVSGALDHQHVLLGADVDEVEGRGEHLLDRRVGAELAVDLGDANAGSRARTRDVGNGEGRGGAVHHQDVRLVHLIGGQEQADDLDLVEESLREERTAGTIAKAGGEDLLFGGTTFTLEIAAGETAGCGVLFAVVDGQGEEILAWPHRRGRGCGHEHVRLAQGHGHRAIGELREVAGGEFEPHARDFDGLFVVHLFVSYARASDGRNCLRHATGNSGVRAIFCTWGG